jgi:hypothetical protein
VFLGPSEALQAIFGSPFSRDGGPLQECPPEGAFAYPSLYRPLAYYPFYELDYDNHPNWLEAPGNPE